MTKLLAVIQLTIRESFAKKTFIAFFAIATIFNLLLLFALNLDIVNGLESSVSIFGEEMDKMVGLQEIIFGIEGVIAALLFTAGIFLALFATSSLVRSFLQKGSIDLLISKPLSRFQILLGRYLGAVAVVAFNIAYMMIFSWLVLSLKTGIWNMGFLYAGGMIIITFAILFALMTFLSVLVQSGPFALMITYFLILFLSPLLLARDNIYALLSSKYYGYALDGLYHFLPKTAELGNITKQLVTLEPITSWLPFWTSLLFGILMFASASFVFSRKNF